MFGRKVNYSVDALDTGRGGLITDQKEKGDLMFDTLIITIINSAADTANEKSWNASRICVLSFFGGKHMDDGSPGENVPRVATLLVANTDQQKASLLLI